MNIVTTVEIIGSCALTAWLLSALVFASRDSKKMKDHV